MLKQLKKLNLGEFEKGTITRCWLHIVNNGLGEPVRVPIMVAKGKKDGPVLGLTAALHGNELNGIPVIQRIFKYLDMDQLCGTLVGVMVVNVPSVHLEKREAPDGTDLNRIAPGLANGNISQVYIHRVIDRIVQHFDFLIDLHTASFGRVNTFYVRADMSDEQTARMARLQNAEIILNNHPNDTTLRGAAASLGIKSITLELKDPHLFQYDVIEHSIEGIHNVFYDLGMQEGMITCGIKDTILCENSYWMYTDEGGLLYVYSDTAQEIKKGERVASVRNIFGDVTKEYFAKEDGIIIGKSTNPINQTGSRIIHLGLNYRSIPCLVR